MNWLSLYIVLLTGSLLQPAQAQWRLVHTSQDVLRLPAYAIPDTSADPITLIEPRGELSKYLIVRRAHSKRELVLRKDVWGFIDDTNGLWRVYKNELCRVMKYNGTWVEYGLYRSRSTARSSSPIVWYEPGFSRGLDGKIWNTWSQAMADAPSGHIVR